MAARTQQKYQVRFAWGTGGAARIAPDTHLLVWVDVLPARAGRDDGDRRRELRSLASQLPDGPEVVLGHLGNARAVAERVTRLQAERGDRCVVAIVAAGRHHAPGDDAAEAAGEAADVPDAPDFAVEDLLAAGALVDALAEVGIDHTSPEAAAACAAYTGLRRAVKHLVSASEAAAALGPADVHAALAADGELVTLRESNTRA
ncbi:2-phosphosulfolactate phosphatase [Curtobacterium pusillum]|uniref:2-phosphosulfolactate phosphatase n=1 Tax=Curtobacterium pusillum TaxID=69373 RepID=UPI0021B68DD8|nr:2-phosphosulfolactate phosphatase [Curtobacterium pusillum]